MTPLESVLDIEALAAGKLAHLPRGLLDHCLRVSRMARAMALPAGADPERTALAGVLHDVARAATGQELLAAAERYGLPVDPLEQRVPVLLHGPVGAFWVREELGLDDPEILSAIAWHTTGHPAMTPLEKAVFLADKLEPGREGRASGLDAVRAVAARDGIDAGMLAYFDQLMRRLLDERAAIHPAALVTRNALLEALAPAP